MGEQDSDNLSWAGRLRRDSADQANEPLILVTA